MQIAPQSLLSTPARALRAHPKLPPAAAPLLPRVKGALYLLLEERKTKRRYQGMVQEMEELLMAEVSGCFPVQRATPNRYCGAAWCGARDGAFAFTLSSNRFLLHT
jgi:hypothetical protein